MTSSLSATRSNQLSYEPGNSSIIPDSDKKTTGQPPVVSKDHTRAIRPKSPDSCIGYDAPMPSNGDLLGMATVHAQSLPFQDPLV